MNHSPALTDTVTAVHLTTDNRQLKTACVVGLLGCLIPLGFAWYTGHTWEDFYITFRHSQNLCEGNGLVYNPPERVHGFTSPLGTLLPALCYLATGMSSSQSAIWIFRGLTILAYAAGGVILWRTFLAARPEFPWCARFFACLYLLDAKTICFSTSGMETALMLLFIAWAMHLLGSDGAGRWLSQGICWAGFMWTRPDGCVYIFALALARLVFGKGSRRAIFLGLLPSALVAAVLYLPWFIFAWRYYGSPVPHTIIAKSNPTGGAVAQVKQGLENLRSLFVIASAVIYEPAYFRPPWFENGWLDWFVMVASKYLGLFSAFYWLCPVDDRLGRAASLCFAIVCFYFCFIFIWPWYTPPPLLFGLIALARGVPTLFGVLARLIGRFRPAAVLIRMLGAMAALFLIAMQLAHLAAATIHFQVRQNEIEMGTRAQVGLWLKAHIGPAQRVYLEPLGYIGYFSGAYMMDYPGLVSPEVVRLRQQGYDKYTLIPHLQPDWIVFRVSEWEDARARPHVARFLADRYEEQAQIKHFQRISAYRFLPGRSSLHYDSWFVIFKKRASHT